MNGALTDSQFWDGRWAKSGGPIVIGPRHRIYGRSGAFLRVLEREVGPIHGSALELGGAASYYLLALAKWRGLDVAALDFSPVGLQQTEDIFKTNGLQVKTVESDFFAWRPETKFDLVLHLGVIEHFTRPEDVMRICADLLAPGGKVFFTMPNMAALGARLWNRWSPNDWSKHIYHSDEAVAAACEAAGLRLERSFHWGAPMFQATRWERDGVGQRIVGAAQRGANLINRAVPFYHLGGRLWSASRGFVAVPED